MKPIDQLSDDELAHAARRAGQLLPAAPAAWRQAALALWPRQHPLLQKAGQALRQVQALLSFDSWATPAAALGMRSAGDEPRQLLYSAQGRDIDLRIGASAEHFVLSGQVLGPDERGMAELVTLGAADAGHAARIATLDTLGAFRIEALLRGTYQLTLRLGGEQIVLPPIDVGERPD